MDKTDILSNSHNDLLVSANAPDATVDYNIQVDSAGACKVTLRVLGTGKVDLLEKDQVIGSADVSGSDVQSLDVTTTLPAGAQTLRVRMGGNGTVLSSLTFAKP
jgi:hypothetical protein